MRIQPGFCAAVFFLLAAIAPAQKNPPAESGAVIRSETRVVLVDAVVTDKKGNYLRDLTQKDFKIWEDNKQQEISSFSFEADPASPVSSQPRYIVLFFDNATMDLVAQTRARDAASKFIDSNAGPNRLMAIVNFTGSLQIAQNFTADAERLKNVVKGVKFSFVSPSSSRPFQLGGGLANFGVRDVILAIRELGKNLGAVPGRKSMILFTGGFPITPDILPEVTAAISTCNRSNVAIYPIDVRGLVAPFSAGPGGLGAFNPAPLNTSRPYFVNAAFLSGGQAFFAPFQQRGGISTQPPGGRPTTPTPTSGGGRTPTTPSGPGTTPRNPGTSGGGGGRVINPAVRNTPALRNPYNQPRVLIPKLPPSPATNQTVMYMLADGTGGFVILNTNDLLGGLEKIGRELNEFYLLGYTPPESDEGSCHLLRVKVEHGANVRARTGYCDTKPKEMLAQSPIEKVLESRVSGQQAGNVAASMQAPYFYTSDNVARVNVAMEISPDHFKFAKEKGKFRSVINVLGVADRPDGSAGARFSDSVKLEFDDKKEVEAFKKQAYHYENQFDIGAGRYVLKIAFSSGGDSFGKVETPLAVDAYQEKQFGVSPPAFSTSVRSVAQMDVNMDAVLIEDRKPLIVSGYEIIPSGTNRFKAADKPKMYVEVYEPLLVTPDPAKPVAVALQMRVLDGKTGEKKVDTGLFRINVPEKGGNPTIPLGLKVPVDTLGPGNYRLELIAVDSAGANAKRLADFVIE